MLGEGHEAVRAVTIDLALAAQAVQADQTCCMWAAKTAAKR